MVHYVGLDVALKMTSVCVLDRRGVKIEEARVETDPISIGDFLLRSRRRYKVILLEAGSLSRWLYDGLTKMGLPAVIVETRHAHNILRAARAKTDRNDARGLAEMARVGLYKPVVVRTEDTQRQRALMTARDLLVAKAVDLEVAIRGLLRGFGIKLGTASKVTIVRRVNALIAKRPLSERAALERVIRPLLRASTVLREQASYIQADITDAARADPVCQRLMTAPGVGPMIAMTYKLAIESPYRFRRSRSVAPFLGLTPRISQSGDVARYGHISCWGDAAARRALFMAARSVILVQKRPSWLRTWGLQVAERRGKMRAIVAVARRLAGVLHRMWVDRTEFRMALVTG